MLDANSQFMIEHMFDCLQDSINSPAFDTDLIPAAVEYYLNNPHTFVGIEGCDPDHPATQAAIAINIEHQECIDTMFADAEGCNIWSGDYD
jgi:hypothetical protein